jgi:hypothetical protein
LANFIKRFSSKFRLPVSPLLSLLALCAVSEARVFWRSGGGPLGGGASDPVWRLAYRADVNINGGKAALEVWSAELEYGMAVEQLRARARQAGEAVVLKAPDMTWGFLEARDRMTRLLAVRLDGGNTIVYQTSQSREDYLASQGERTYRLAVAAPPPDSAPGTYVANDSTGLAMQGLQSGLPPEDVRRHYADALTAAGWSPLPLELHGTTGPDVYMKGAEYVFVFAKSAGGGGGTTVMLAHKRRVRNTIDAPW